MRKCLCAVVMALSSQLTTCAREDASGLYGGHIEPPPESLLEIASVVRRGGGVVVRGRVVGGWALVAPERLLATGSHLEYGRARATMRVEDALGASVTGDLSVLGGTGVVRWTDADGRPTGQAVGVSDQVRGRQQLSADAAGVFFLYPRAPVDGGAQSWFVYWIAPVNEANEASGEDTRSGAVPLSALRI